MLTFYFEIGFPFVALAVLKLTLYNKLVLGLTHLPLAPECQDEPTVPMKPQFSLNSPYTLAFKVCVTMPKHNAENG